VNISLYGNTIEDAQMFLGDKGEADKAALTKGINRGGIKEVSIADNRNRALVSLSLDKRWSLWSFPVETVTSGFRGKSIIYQSTALLVRQNISLEAHETWKGSLVLKIEKK
jgi:alpha-amylase